MAYIGLDRGIVDHWIYQDAEYFKVWFEMLYRARFAKEPATELIEGRLVVIEQGEFIFGRLKWSERLGISERRLRTLMDKLIADNMIHLTQRAPKFSKYCVTNFAKYRPHTDQQQTLDTKGISDSGDHQNDQQTTSKRPANDQQTTTKEEGNKENKVKKEIKHNTFSAYTSNPDLFSSLIAFEEFRKKIKKPMTDRAKELLIKKLDGYGSTDEEKIAIMNQSILNGWQGVFPLSNKMTGGQLNAVNGGYSSGANSGIDFGF